MTTMCSQQQQPRATVLEITNKISYHLAIIYLFINHGKQKKTKKKEEDTYSRQNCGQSSHFNMNGRTNEVL